MGLLRPSLCLLRKDLFLAKKVHCKDTVPKIGKNITRMEIAASVPISTFYDWSACSAAQNMWTDPGNLNIAQRFVYMKSKNKAAQIGNT
jgi:hypothetical protein